MTYSFQMTATPAAGLEEFQVYELEVDCGWWTLNQRVHADDIGHLPLHQQALAWGVANNVTLAQIADNFMPFRYMSLK